MNKRALCTVVAMVLLTGCFGRKPDVSSYVATSVSGNVQVKDAESTGFKKLADGAKLVEGSQIRVLSDSAVTLSRGTESFIRLRPFDPAERCMELRGTERVDCLDSSDDEISPPAQMAMTSIKRFDVASGDVLVHSDPTAPVEVISNGVQATTEEGTFRFDRRLSLRVGVYEGTTNIEAAGAVLSLPSLREGVVAGRVLPRAPSLLRFRPGDPWDRELLKDVIDLDNELDAQQRGYEGKFGGRTEDVDDEMDALTDMVPDADLSFLRSTLDEYRKGDVLVGMVLAFLLRDAGKGEPKQHYMSLLDLLDQGATWGFLARDNGVPSEDLIGGVVRAIGLRTGDVTPGTTITSPTPAPTRSGTRPTTSPTPTRSSKPSPTPTKPTPTKTPSPTPTPSPSESCVPVGPVCVG